MAASYKNPTDRFSPFNSRPVAIARPPGIGRFAELMYFTAPLNHKPSLKLPLQLFRVRNIENQPNLKRGRLFFTSRLKKPGRFDYICYKAVNPEKGVTLFTHRLCGIPGDTLEIRNGILYVNKENVDLRLRLMHVYKINSEDTFRLRYDPALTYTVPPYTDTLYVPLEDQYVQNNSLPCKRHVLPPGLRDEKIFRVFRKNWNQDNFGPVRIPKDKYFVLGDNRGHSTDSRYLGLIPRSNYIGTVLWK